MNATILKQLIESELNDSEAIVKSNDNVHFEAIVISTLFEGITKLKQQQMIYKVLNDYITSGELHALALKTYTPNQWHQLNNA
ncbi:BolA/IbaG family iron-sulfur metabolism protein [Thiotrichales bacterium 19S11-10]|nr:BolA/IbaG family iron-sulfur metabolism protein [Thiotrichales bacterium 19S11-10]